MAQKKNTPPKNTKSTKNTKGGNSNVRWYLMLALKIVAALAVVLLFLYMYWGNQNEEARMYAKIEQLKKEIGAQAASLSDSHDELSELAAELEETEFELKESEEESVQLEHDISTKMKEMLSLQKQKETQREQMRQANSAKMEAKQKEIAALIAVYQSNINALSTGSPEELKKIAAEKKASIDKIKETNAAEIAAMETSYSKLATVVDEDITTRKELMKEELDNDFEKYDKQIEKLQAELEQFSETDGETSMEKIKLLNGEITVIGGKRAATQEEYVAELLSVDENKKKELAEMQKDKRAAINARKAAHAQFISKEEASYKAMIRNDETERTAIVNEHKKQIEQLTFEKDSEIQELGEQNNSLETDLSKVTNDLAVMRTQKETINTRNADLQKAIEVHKKRDEEIKKLTSVYQCKSNTSTDIANCTTKAKAGIASKKLERDILVSTITKVHADGVAALKMHKGWKTNSVYTPCPNGSELVGGGPGDTYACVFQETVGAACVPGYNIPISQTLVLGKVKQFYTNLPSCNFQSGNVWYIPWNSHKTYDEHIINAKKYRMHLATFNTTEEWNSFITFERAYRPKYYGQKGGYHVGMESITKNGVFKGNPRTSESWKYYDNSVFFKDVAPGDTVPPFKFIVHVYEHPLGLKPINPTVGFNVGKYNIPNHLNDKISFILVHAGYAVTIFEHPNQTGRSEKFTGSKNILDTSFEGKISSILIEKTENGRPEMFKMINSNKRADGITGAVALEGRCILPVERSMRLPAFYKITAPTADIAHRRAKEFMIRLSNYRDDTIVPMTPGSDKKVYTIDRTRPLKSENGRYELIIKDRRVQLGPVGGPHKYVSGNQPVDMIVIASNGTLRFVQDNSATLVMSIKNVKYFRLINNGTLMTDTKNLASVNLNRQDVGTEPKPMSKPSPKPMPKPSSIQVVSKDFDCKLKLYTDYPGNDIANKHNVISPYACAAYCKYTHRATHFSVDTQARNCYCKSGISKVAKHERMVAGSTCYADEISNGPSGVAVARVLAYHPHHQKEGYSGNFFGVGVEHVNRINAAKIVCVHGVPYPVKEVVKTTDPKIAYVYLPYRLKKRVMSGGAVIIGNCPVMSAAIGAKKPAPSPTSKGCHPNDCMISTEHGAVAIQHLSIGDRVYTPSGYEPIIGFFDKDSKKMAEYYEIALENKQQITVSRHHAIPINGKMTDPSLIKHGDAINTLSGLTSVTSNTKVLKQGAHHFLVPSGLYYIDNVICSDYTMHLPLVMFNLVHMYINARYAIGVPIVYREQSLLSPYWPYHILGKLNASTSIYNICSVLFVPLVLLTEFILAVYVSINKK